VGGDDHILALAHAVENFDKPVAPHAELDRSRLEAPIALVDQRAPSLTRPMSCGGLDRTRENARYRRLAPHSRPLHAIETDPDRAYVLLLTFVDGDIIHPHPVFFRHRRRVGETHRVAVVEDLAFALGSPTLRARQRGLLIVVDREVIPAIDRLFGCRRKVRLAVGILPIQHLAGRGAPLPGDCGRRFGPPLKWPRTSAETVAAEYAEHGRCCDP